MAPASDRESAVLDHMRRRFDHVSAERLLSGPGLVNLYGTLAEIDRIPSKGYTAAQITDLGMRGEDPVCAEATAMFCAMLGNVAGDSGADPGGARRRVRRRRDRATARRLFRAIANLRPVRGKGPVRGLSGGDDPDLVVTYPLAAFVGCAALLAA